MKRTVKGAGKMFVMSEEDRWRKQVESKEKNATVVT